VSAAPRSLDPETLQNIVQEGGADALKAYLAEARSGSDSLVMTAAEIRSARVAKDGVQKDDL
jgi:hypothetical protein